MELNKNQTIQLTINHNKVESFKQRYKFTTKYKWWCLSCLSVLYVSYKQYGINSIFCDECYPKMVRKETIVQYQYMRVLKDRQMKLIESQINKS
jgi:hypothetical protein